MPPPPLTPTQFFKDEKKLSQVRYQKLTSVGCFNLFFTSHYNSGSYIRTVPFYLDHQFTPFRQEKGLIVPYLAVFLLSHYSITILIHLPPPPRVHIVNPNPHHCQVPFWVCPEMHQADWACVYLSCFHIFSQCFCKVELCDSGSFHSLKWRDRNKASKVVMKVWMAAPL